MAITHGFLMALLQHSSFALYNGSDPPDARRRGEKESATLGLSRLVAKQSRQKRKTEPGKPACPARRLAVVARYRAGVTPTLTPT